MLCKPERRVLRKPEQRVLRKPEQQDSDNSQQERPSVAGEVPEVYKQVQRVQQALQDEAAPVFRN